MKSRLVPGIIGRTSNGRSSRAAAVGIVIALAASGCAASETAGEDEGTEGTAQDPAATTEPTEDVAALESLAEVYEALDGLTGDEREQTLLSLAQVESGDFTVYLTTEERVSNRWLETFSEKSGIDAQSYRASSSDLLQRLTQEADADFREGADVVLTNGPEMIYLDTEVGIFEALDSPTTDSLTPENVFPNWAGYSANAHMVMWNATSTDPDEMPDSIEDLLSDPPGRLILEGRNWEWFATLVTQWLMGEKGMTEEEAVDVFRQGMSNTATTQGHDFLNTFIVSGEYDVSATSYLNAVLALVDEGAPVAWEPAVEPLVARPAGAAIHTATDRPATSLLFVEHMFTDVQQLLAEDFFIPLSSDAGGADLLSGSRVVYQETERLLDEREKWESLWQELVQGAGAQEEPEG